MKHYLEDRIDEATFNFLKSMLESVQCDLPFEKEVHGMLKENPYFNTHIKSQYMEYIYPYSLLEFIENFHRHFSLMHSLIIHYTRS